MEYYREGMKVTSLHFALPVDLMGNVIETERLILRSVSENDLMQINKLVNNKKISEVTRSIPYPSSVEDTRMWYQKQKEERGINLP